MLIKEPKETGATMVELAVVLPLFLLVVFGIFDFSRVISRRTIASNAIRTAARVVATIPSPSSQAECLAVANTKITQELDRYGLSNTIQTGSINVQRDTSFIIPAINVSAGIRIDCITCPIFRAGLTVFQADTGFFNFQPQALIPLENPASCS